MSPNDWQRDKPLVTDTNTVLSALVGGTTRKLILDLDRDLRYPEQSFDEIQRNLGVIHTDCCNCVPDRSGAVPRSVRK